MPTVYPASEVARWLLWRAQQDNTRLSNKKLQKLVYYAQAWNLALNDDPLFAEDIQAWVHGPVVPSLYREYKHYGYQPITEQVGTVPSLGAEAKELLEEIWNVYGGFDANYLEILTHSERPWQEAREALEFNENSERIISRETMKEFYRTRLNEVGG